MADRKGKGWELNLVILHYHLQASGVSRAVANHLAAIRLFAGSERLRIVILHGGRIDDSVARDLSRHSVTVRSARSLDYDSNGPAQAQPIALANDLTSLMQAMGIRPEDSVLHAHNHSLGKNVSLPGALIELRRRGFRLLLQIHDFPEDLRPRNYARLRDAAPSDVGAYLYPRGSGIHYAVLNGRDYRILVGAGLEPRQLHLLPNPVVAGPSADRGGGGRDDLERRFGIPRKSTYLLYPVRAIRRKNIGEAILWSFLGGDDTYVGVTLPATSDAERPTYLEWKGFATRENARIRFETGGADGLPLHDNVGAANQLLTTSVAEGFGMVFLEGPLARRPLLGRDLPEITADFTKIGIRFPGLAPRMRVPVDDLDLPTLRARWREAFNAVRRGYATSELRDGDWNRVESVKIQNGFVDFADLDEETQRMVLYRTAKDPRFRGAIADANPNVATLNDPSKGDENGTMELNGDIIRQHFGPQAIGLRLLNAYRDLMGEEAVSELAPLPRADSILDTFLDFSRFQLIRLTEAAAGPG